MFYPREEMKDNLQNPPEEASIQTVLKEREDQLKRQVKEEHNIYKKASQVIEEQQDILRESYRRVKRFNHELDEISNKKLEMDHLISTIEQIEQELNEAKREYHEAVKELEEYQKEALLSRKRQQLTEKVDFVSKHMCTFQVW